MTIKVLIEKIDLKPLTQFEDRVVDGVIVSDMVSDVMASAKSGNLWITIQTHKSIVPAANLVDISAIIIANGKKVPQDTIDIANKHEVAILTTQLPTFELVGKLFNSGLGTK